MDYLSGTTVIDLTANVAGPFSTLVMEDMGARVIKVESPETYDPVRGWPPFGQSMSTTFASLNRGKESIALDLKSSAGQEVFEALIGSADVLVQSMRPDAAKKLGLEFTRIAKVNDKIISCAIDAFGERGPLAGKPGYDAVIQAYSGIMSLTGEKDGPPVRVGTGLIDLGTGMWAAMGVLGAMVQRGKTGQGSEVRATLLGTAVSFLPHHIASFTMAGVIPRRLGSAQHNAAPYEVIRTDDDLILIGAANDGLWARLCGAIDRLGLLASSRYASNAERVANRDELVRDIERSIDGMKTHEVLSLLDAANVPASVVRGVEDLVDDPQVVAMRLLGKTPDGDVLASTPFRDVAERPLQAAPTLGQHTRDILRWIGRSDEDIARLKADGTVAGPDL